MSSVLRSMSALRPITAIAGGVGLVIAAVALPAPTAAYAANGNTTFVAETFSQSAPTTSPWTVPSAPSGSNAACLTATPGPAPTSIPDCTSSQDPAGHGVLRLTTASTTVEGGVGYGTAIPDSKGLDATFNSYQYGGNGADGIGFYLAATNPSNPQVPSAIGQPGGALGYSVRSGSVGLVDGYLGVGLDAFGNYANTSYEGTGCTDPSWDSSTTFPNQVSVRGPGNGTVGYCMLNSTASTGTHTWKLTGGGSGTRSSSGVPVEVVINPTNAALTTNSGLTVPALSYEVAFTPLSGTQQTLTGTLPSTTNGGLSASLYPSSWIDPSTGVPYDLTFGWVASTGGSDDVHEISNLSVSSLSGALPVIAATDSGATSAAHGATVTSTVTPSLSSSGGSESDPVTMTFTLPGGLTYSSATGSGWSSFVHNGSTVTGTYTPSSALPAGSTLPQVRLVTTASGNAGTSPATSYTVSSPDGGSASGTLPVSITQATPTMTASAAPSSTSYGTNVALSDSGLAPDATGTVTFTSNGTTLCTATLPSNTCNAGSTLAPASYPVTATYSGDTNYAGTTASTSFIVGRASVSGTVTGSPASSTWGTPVSFAVNGLPGNATGTVAVNDAAGDTLCTITLANGSTCTPSASLQPGSYPVSGAYSGDTNYSSATLTGNTVTVAKAGTNVAGSASSSTHGNDVTLTATGLPTDATGTVTFTDADSGAGNGTTLCTATLPATTCTVPAADMAVGNHSVTVSYPGDSHYTGSSSTFGFTYNQASTTLAAQASPTTSAYGSPVTLTASGLPSDATGTVTFTDAHGNQLCQANIATTDSCRTAPNLGPAQYAVTATYSGDANYMQSTATTSFTVTKADIAADPTVSPSPASYGQTLTFTDAATFPADATGTIVFTDPNGNTLCQAGLPQTSCTDSATLPAGSFTATMTYTGDSNYNTNTATVPVTIDKAQFTMGTPDQHVTFGTDVTLTLSGIPSDGTGTVTVTDTQNNATLCQFTAPGDSCDLGTLAVGSYPLDITYTGDGNYADTSTTATITVAKQATSLTAAATPGSAQYGNAITLAGNGLPSTASGTITFTDHATGTVLCQAVLPSATSCPTPTNLAVGHYDVDVAYSGDGSYAGSTATTGFDIDAVPTAVTVSADQSSVTVGTVSTFTVGGLPSDATGTVTLTDANGNTLCTVQAPGGQCTATLPVGSETVTATYPGDDVYGPSHSSTTVQVGQRNATLTATASPASTPWGNAVTLTGSGLPAAATGTITFTDHATGDVLCTATLPAQSCQTSPTLAIGSYAVDAAYSGDADDTSADATTAFSIAQDPTQLTLSADHSTVALGDPVTFTAGGLPSAATGTVTFTDTSTGQQLCRVTLPVDTCDAPALALGNHDVTAMYSGDATYGGSVDSTSVTVVRDNSPLIASASPSQTTYGNSVDLTATNLPGAATGTVTFTDAAGTTLCTTTLPTTTCTTPGDLPVGIYQVTAAYSGDGTYAPATATTAFTIEKVLPVAMGVRATPDPQTVGAPVTLTATGLPTAATGTVTFTDAAGTTLCTATLPTRSCSTTTLPLGNDTVRALYSGDTHYGAIASATVVTIVKHPTAVQPRTRSTTTYGERVQLTAAQLPAGATGTVTLSVREGSRTLTCTVTLPHTTCTLPGVPPVGRYVATAVYHGDEGYLPSTGTTSFTVVRATPNTSAGASSTSVRRGHEITLTMTGLPNGATGTITFTGSDGTTLCTATLPATSCTATLSAVGNQVVTASYSGDRNYRPVSQTFPITVTDAGTSSTVPSQHTGEPFSGWLYYGLAASIGIGGAALIAWSRRRRA